MLSKNQQKFISSLSQKKQRDESQLFVVEGVKPVEELLNSLWEIQSIWATSAWLNPAIEQKLTKQRIDYVLVSEAELGKISQLRTPNQVLAVAKMKEFTAPDLKQGYFLVLDGVNDPGNLGTLIRIADWFGMAGVICSPNTADRFNSKVVQSTMGSLFRVPVWYEDLTTVISRAKQGQVAIYLADMVGEPINQVTFKPNGLLVMGSESHGIQPGLIKQSGGIVITIPKIGNAESLNVGVAAGIICSKIFL